MSNWVGVQFCDLRMTLKLMTFIVVRRFVNKIMKCGQYLLNGAVGITAGYVFLSEKSNVGGKYTSAVLFTKLVFLMYISC